MIPTLKIEDISEISLSSSITPYMKDSLNERFNLALQKAIFGKGLLILNEEEKEELLKLFESDNQNGKDSRKIAFKFMEEKIPQFQEMVDEEVNKIQDEAKMFYQAVNTQ